MAYYEKKYFDGTPEFYMYDSSEQTIECIKNKYIENISNNPNFDYGFKSYVKNKDNIIVNTHWGYVAYIKCNHLDVKTNYTTLVISTTGYHGTIENDRVSLERDTSASRFESTMPSYFHNYLIATYYSDLEERKINTKYNMQSVFKNRKKKKITEIPNYINIKDKNFSSNGFIRSAYRNSNTSDIEEKVKKERLSSDKIISIDFDGCYVEGIEIVFVPYYVLHVKYQNESYCLIDMLGANDVKNDNSIGKLSREYIKREKRKATIDNVFYPILFLNILAYIVLFIMLCIKADKIDIHTVSADPVIFLYITLSNIGPAMFFVSIAVAFIILSIYGKREKPKSKIISGIIASTIAITYLVFFITIYLKVVDLIV